MQVIIQFDKDEDHVRAVGVLSEAEETYHGVGKGAILVSSAALSRLDRMGIPFRVIGEKPEEEGWQ